MVFAKTTFSEKLAKKLQFWSIWGTKITKFHDFGGMNVSVTFQGGSKKDKKFCMPPKPRVGNQPLQEVRILNLKAEISRLCLKFVKSDPPDEERD